MCPGEAAEAISGENSENKNMPVQEEADAVKESAVDPAPASVDMIAKNIYLEMTREQLLSALKKILADGQMNAHRDVAQIKQRFYALKNAETDEEIRKFVEAGNPVDAFAARPDEAEEEFRQALAEFKQKRSEYLAAEEEQKANNLILKNKIIEQLRNLAEDIDNINLHFPKFKQLQQEFRQITEIPESAVSETWKVFQAVTEQFYDRFMMNKELRDLDFKKNLEVKRDLIDQARSLADVADVVEASRRLQDLHAKWRETGPVAKELRDEIWEEFKAASTVVNKRHQDYFEARKEAEKANEAAKTALCEKIEAIDLEGINGFSKWDELTKQVLDMQAEWKTLGYASKKANNLLFARFRKSCDDFFAAKAESFRKNKEEHADNLRRKTELCEKAEALRESADVKDGIKEVVRLQEEWKKIGPVPKKYNDSVWQRFREACNYFFDERKKQTASTRKTENENFDIKSAILENLRKVDLEKPREEALKEVRELQAQWQQTGFVPFKKKEKLQADYRELMDEIYGKLNVRLSNERMSRFEDRIANAGEAGMGREREKLQRALEGRRNELKTFENNMGFFNVKSNQGSAMLREMEKKIERLKKDIEEIGDKIRLLDSKAN